MRRHAIVSGALPLLLLLAACAGAAKPVAPGTPQPSLEGPAIETLASVLRAEDRRVVDEALRRALTDPDARVRARAVRALARIGGEGAGEGLLAALADPDAPVRVEAAFGLGQLARGSAPPRLLDAAKDSDASVRAAVAEALGKIHDPASAEVVASLLDDGDSVVRANARLGVWKFADPAFALERLIRSGSPDALVEFSAAYALARLAAAGSEPAASGAAPGRLTEADRARARQRLVAFADSKIPEIRMQAARGLVAPKDAYQMRLLSKLTSDPDLGVRINAIRSICFPGMSQETAIRAALKTEITPLVVTVGEGLARIATEPARNMLVQGILNEPSLWVKETMFLALGRLDPELAAGIANGMSKDPAPELRAAAARNVTSRTDPRSREIVQRLLEDPDPRVASAAVASRGGAEGPLADLLRGAPSSPDPAVREAVANVAGLRLDRPRLTQEEREEALAMLESLWARAAGDKLPIARIGALDAASKAGKDPRAHALLLAGLDDADRVVRIKAIDRLRAVFGEDHSGRAGAAIERPLSEYVEILRWASQPRAAVVTVAREGGAPGRFTIALDTQNAPLASWNFAQLAERGFFDGLRVHRVVPNFVVQDGDPRGDGNGDPGYSIRDEFGRARFVAGTVGMASDGPDTAGSQWFVTLSAQPHLDGRYTVFGSVVQNLGGVVLRILPQDRVVSVRCYAGDGTETLPPL